MEIVENPVLEPNPIEARVAELVASCLVGTPHFLVELIIRGRKGSQVVEVFLDSDEALGVGDLAKVSRALSMRLDEEDLIAGKYKLNVSSPGASRPLVVPRQYPKHIGRKMEIYWQAGDTSQSVQGILQGLGEDHILLQKKKGVLEIPFAAIEKALVLLPW